MGIDGRVFPISASPKTAKDVKSGETVGLDFMDDWYPIQVKQKDRAGRPDIDSFEAAMIRSDRQKGFFVAFDFSSDALKEVDGFFRRSKKIIIPLTVKEILEEQIARKLA